MSSSIGAFIDRTRLATSRWNHIALVLAILGMLSACDIKREWKEEVSLANGKVVVLERKSLRERFGELGAAGYGRLKEEVVVLREPRMLEWRSDLAPVTLEIDGSGVHVIGWIRGWHDCEKYGYPRPPFVYFRSTAAGCWKQIDAAGAPATVKPNLLLNPWQESMAQVHADIVVDLSTKSKLNESVFVAIPGLRDFHLARSSLDDRALVQCLYRPRT